MKKSEIYKAAINLRLHQSALAASFHINSPKNPIHLALGHELACIAYLKSLPQGQLFCLPHRNIHFNVGLALLLNGRETDSIISEIIGEKSGILGGKLGSMNLSIPDFGGIYTSSILANSLGVAAGAALALKNEESGRRVTVVIGDGAIEEGRFWEVVTLAGKYSLPCDFYIEDNGWSMQTSLEDRRLQFDYQAIANATGLNYLDLNFSSSQSVSKSLENLSLRAYGPRIILSKVETLGGKWVEEHNIKRYINYHSGTIMCSNDLLLKSFGIGLSDSDLLDTDTCEKYLGIERAKNVFNQRYEKLIGGATR